MPRDILKELRAAPAVLSNLGPPATRIIREAADEIERLRAAMMDACNLLTEAKQGSPARSPGHNARLLLEATLKAT